MHMRLTIVMAALTLLAGCESRPKERANGEPGSAVHRQEVKIRHEWRGKSLAEGNLVMRSATELPNGFTPEAVDFEKEMLIGAFLGSYAAGPSGPHCISITRVVEHRSHLEVSVQRVRSETWYKVALPPTADHFHVVAVAESPKPLRFSVDSARPSDERISCPPEVKPDKVPPSAVPKPKQISLADVNATPCTTDSDCGMAPIPCQSGCGHPPVNLRSPLYDDFIRQIRRDDPCCRPDSGCRVTACAQQRNWPFCQAGVCKLRER